MIVLLGTVFLLYGIKYFMYKKHNGEVSVKIFDYLLSIATVSIYVFFLFNFVLEKCRKISRENGIISEVF